MVAHGGEEVSTEPTRATQLAVLRMVPIARAIRRALPGGKILVLRPRFTVRGWNGAAASPVGDLLALLDGIRTRDGVPVMLVGHSMGARAALRAAAHPSVCAVAALAPCQALPDSRAVSRIRVGTWGSRSRLGSTAMRSYRSLV